MKIVGGLLFVGLWATAAYANVAADNLPVSQPLATVGNSMALSVAPIVLRIAIILAGVYIAYSRSITSIVGLVGIVVGGTLAMKAIEFMLYLGWSGVCF